MPAVGAETVTVDLELDGPTGRLCAGRVAKRPAWCSRIATEGRKRVGTAVTPVTGVPSALCERHVRWALTYEGAVRAERRDGFVGIAGRAVRMGRQVRVGSPRKEHAVRPNCPVQRLKCPPRPPEWNSAHLGRSNGTLCAERSIRGRRAGPVKCVRPHGTAHASTRNAHSYARAADRAAHGSVRRTGRIQDRSYGLTATLPRSVDKKRAATCRGRNSHGPW